MRPEASKVCSLSTSKPAFIGSSTPNATSGAKITQKQCLIVSTCTRQAPEKHAAQQQESPFTESMPQFAQSRFVWDGAGVRCRPGGPATGFSYYYYRFLLIRKACLRPADWQAPAGPSGRRHSTHRGRHAGAWPGESRAGATAWPLARPSRRWDNCNTR